MTLAVSVPVPSQAAILWLNANQEGPRLYSSESSRVLETVFVLAVLASSELSAVEHPFRLSLYKYPSDGLLLCARRKFKRSDGREKVFIFHKCLRDSNVFQTIIIISFIGLLFKKVKHAGFSFFSFCRFKGLWGI